MRTRTRGVTDFSFLCIAPEKKKEKKSCLTKPVEDIRVVRRTAANWQHWYARDALALLIFFYWYCNATKTKSIL